MRIAPTRKRAAHRNRCWMPSAALPMSPLSAAAREPFAGIGKPEPLMGNLAGYWSRRIDGTHRLVYAVDDADVVACRGHYED